MKYVRSEAAGGNLTTLFPKHEIDSALGPFLGKGLPRGGVDGIVPKGLTSSKLHVFSRRLAKQSLQASPILSHPTAAANAG